MIEFESMVVGGEDRLDAGARQFVPLALGGGDQRMDPAGLATEKPRLILPGGRMRILTPRGYSSRSTRS